jgi:hypothetical protein
MKVLKAGNTELISSKLREACYTVILWRRRRQVGEKQHPANKEHHNSFSQHISSKFLLLTHRAIQVSGGKDAHDNYHGKQAACSFTSEQTSYLERTQVQPIFCAPRYIRSP